MQYNQFLLNEDVVKILRDTELIVWGQYKDNDKQSMCFALEDSIYKYLSKNDYEVSHLLSIKDYIPEFTYKNCRPIMHLLLSIFVIPFSKFFPCFRKLKKYRKDSQFYWYPHTRKGYLKRRQFLDKLIKLYSVK